MDGQATSGTNGEELMPIALLLLMLLAPFRLFGATLMEFGASGDGVHDDTREIQAAIGQLPPGATLDGEGRAYRIRGSIRISAA